MILDRKTLQCDVCAVEAIQEDDAFPPDWCVITVAQGGKQLWAGLACSTDCAKKAIADAKKALKPEV